VFKSGFVAVTGLANAGKSTIINSLLQERLLITSSKRQTTRKHVRCILTGEDYQMVLVDTPGLHQPKNKLGEFMIKEIKTALENCDVILYILDATRPQPILEGTGKQPVILALNKTDLLSPEAVQALVEQFQEDPRFDAVIPVSALAKDNLQLLIDTVKEYLPPGDMLYPEDQLMDSNYRFLASELIREQALMHLEEEVPHGIAVDIEEFSEGDDQARIAASLIVERDSHKGIVIGKGGSMLKRIGQGARLEIQNLLGVPVHLKLWVKVRKNWRKDPNQLKWLGYK
jgi:GTP-binding protein Era